MTDHIKPALIGPVNFVEPELSTPALRCDECGEVILDVTRLAEIHDCGHRGALRLVLLPPCDE